MSQPLIQLRKISQTFPTAEKPVLQEVNLTVYPGDFLAIIGPSGSGKSTLLNILGLLSTPTSGDYLFEGKPVQQASNRERDQLRARSMGFIFQSSTMLLDQTSLANASMGLRVQGLPADQRAAQAEQTLQQVGLGHRVLTPTKYLSGGERQRCAIARAVAPGPQLILADEPTGNLDSENSQKVLDILQDLNRAGHTIIIITHDPQIAAQARRRASIIDGRLTEEEPASPLAAPSSALADRSAASPSAWLSFKDDLAEATSSLLARPLRAGLLALSFALGVGGLVAALGMSQSASYQVNQRILGSEAQVVYATVNNDQDLLGNYRTGPSAYDHLQQLDQLDYVERAAFQAVVAPADTRITRFSPLEAEPDQALGLVSVSESRLDQLGASLSSPQARQTLRAMNASLELETPEQRQLATSLGAALVTPGAAQALGLLTEGSQELTADAGLWVDGAFLPVAGLVDFGSQAPELSQMVLVPPHLLVTGGQARVQYVLETEPGFTRAVNQALPLVLAPDSPSDITTETPSNLADLRAEVSEDLGLFVGLIAGILLVLASLSAATAMYLSVQSRTLEIALRRAIGASQGLIARLFLIEGLVLGLVGGSLGAAAGMGATLALAQAQGWQAVLSPAFTPAGLAIGGLTGFVSALYPAWVASRKDPAEAMRD